MLSSVTFSTYEQLNKPIALFPSTFLHFPIFLQNQLPSLLQIRFMPLQSYPMVFPFTMKKGRDVNAKEDSQTIVCCTSRLSWAALGMMTKRGRPRRASVLAFSIVPDPAEIQSTPSNSQADIVRPVLLQNNLQMALFLWRPWNTYKWLQNSCEEHRVGSFKKQDMIMELSFTVAYLQQFVYKLIAEKLILILTNGELLNIWGRHHSEFYLQDARKSFRQSQYKSSALKSRLITTCNLG